MPAKNQPPFTPKVKTSELNSEKNRKEKPMLQEIIKIARDCGKIIKNASDKNVKTKNNDFKNLVTDYDVKIQEILKERLTALLPEASFLGEEGQSAYSKDGYCFICDPIDGTTNFVKNYQWSCVSIALMKDGQPFLGIIYNPFLDELYHAEKNKGAFCNNKPIHTGSDPIENVLVAFGTGSYDIAKTWKLAAKYYDASLDIRRSGSGALDLCNVAAGRTGIFWELKLQPWDFAAGALIVTEAGGQIKNENGDDVSDYFAQQSIFALSHRNIPIFSV